MKDKIANVTLDGTVYQIETGTRLSDLPSLSHKTEMPCAGHGLCGKCRVIARGSLSELSETEIRHLSKKEIDEGVRLACCAVIFGECSVQTKKREDAKEQIKLSGFMSDITLDPIFKTYGVAVDIGTTTLAACLYDYNGKLLAKSGRPNPQRVFGADVIVRIEAALKGAETELAVLVRQAIDEMIREMAENASISPLDIDAAVITGNTTMLYLLTKTSTKELSHAPFDAKRLFDETLSASELELTCLKDSARIYLPSCIGAFIGADITTALLASGMCDDDRTQLLVDVGTNGEMVLWHNNRLYFCSTAAGPAFEGAGISMGMAAKEGAIDRVEIVNGKLFVRTIGNAQPVGICGSGIVDAVACLLKLCEIDESGYLEDEICELCPTVSITGQDVRAVQLAKSALHAGMRTLIGHAGLDVEGVKTLHIAGGFGSYLDTLNAASIGLFPRELAGCVKVIGNAALAGAVMLLLDKAAGEKCSEYAKKAEVVELASNPLFAEEYMQRMFFEID